MTAPVTGVWIDHSGTVLAGGASQPGLAVNYNRMRILIENPPSESGSLFFNWTTPASTTAAGSVELVPGGSYDSEMGPVSTEQLNLTAASTGHRYILKEM